MRWSEFRAPGADGIGLYVRQVVEPSAPAVLLLHGLGVGGAVWQSFARRLLPEFAAIAPDLRGHGRSDAPAEGYEPRDYARDLMAFIEEPVPVVGHSLGALVALALADLRPELVQWLVLLDPPVDAARRNADVPEVYRLRHAPAGQLEAYLRGSGSELLAPLFRQAPDAAFQAMLEHNHVAEALERAARITQPCLVVQADPERGGFLGDAAAQQLRQALPNGELMKIASASHAVHATHPAQLAEAIKQWDRRARRRPGPDSTAVASS